jgi:AAA domain
MMPADAFDDATLCQLHGREACEDPACLPPPPKANGKAHGASPATHPRRRLYDDVALMTIPTPPCLIEDRLIAKTLVVLYGPPGKHKTFCNVTLGLSVATGLDWLGAPVQQQGPVVACVAEGTGRYKYRVAAAKQDAGLSLEQSISLYTWCDAFSLLDLGAVRAFIAEVREIHPVMVSFDSLIRFMVGGDDKDSKDMARVVDACGLIQEDLEATVVTIHHTGWDESRERGSIVLRGAADTVMAQRDDDGTLVLQCEKQKDLEEFAPIRLTPLVVPVFDGHSCILKLAPDRLDTGAGEITMKQREALHVLKQLFPQGASHSAWKKALPADYQERTLYRAEQVLVQGGYVRRDGKHHPVFVPLPKDEPRADR